MIVSLQSCYYITWYLEYLTLTLYEKELVWEMLIRVWLELTQKKKNFRLPRRMK